MEFRLRILFIVVALDTCLTAVPFTGLGSEEVGNLTLRFVLDDATPLEKWSSTDETLIVNKANRGIRNVCVWLMRRPGDLFSIDNEKQVEQQNSVISLSGKQLSPRISILRTPQTVVIRNDDPWAYSILGDCSAANGPFNALLKPGNSYEKRIEFREDNPIRLRDSIHAYAGYVLALDHPHAGISDADGKLTIRGIPKGNWPFVIWHERCTRVKKLVASGRLIEPPGGPFWFTIKSGENLEQEVALDSESFCLKR